jgi:Ca2+:H+ antiporter
MVMLYWVFLRNQIGAHSYFFNYSYEDKKRPATGNLLTSRIPPVRLSITHIVGVFRWRYRGQYH